MTVLLNQLDPSPNEIPPLENGDHLDQPTFHERYATMPPGTRAELIGGIVCLSSAVSMPQGKEHGRASGKALVWLDAYEAETPGIEAVGHATVILGDAAEVQPDAILLISSVAGGQTVEENGFVVGAPELVVEVAASTEARDLHIKLRDNERAGAREYVVLLPRRDEVRWFALREGCLERTPPAPDGVFRSRVFPGLWLDPLALLRGDSAAVRAVVDQGVATPEHAAFVRRLAAARSEES